MVVKDQWDLKFGKHAIKKYKKYKNGSIFIELTDEGRRSLEGKTIRFKRREVNA